MTFTYDLIPPVGDVTWVRFHIRDTDSATAIFPDEEIEFAISEEGGKKEAVVALIRQIIGQLAREPDMRVDWMSVNWRTSIEAWQALLSQFEDKFGLNNDGVSSSGGGNRAERDYGV